MNVAVYLRSITEPHREVLLNLLQCLHGNGARISIYERFGNYAEQESMRGFDLRTFGSHEDLVEQQVRYIISVGGDGTLLDTLSFVRNSGIPVLGINTGRLGFLAGIAKADIETAIPELLKGHYTIDRRTLLYLESDLPIFPGSNFALNDITVHKKDSSSMITIHAYLNGEYLNSYWSDGLIISSPTGSTGYSLSCGGPIIFPNSSNFVITPIAPHNLNVRPIVISDNNVISFDIEGRSASFLVTLDSRSESITSNVQLAVKKADFTMNLIRLHSENFLNTLRNKLMWGLDNRN